MQESYQMSLNKFAKTPIETSKQVSDFDKLCY